MKYQRALLIFLKKDELEVRNEDSLGKGVKPGTGNMYLYLMSSGSGTKAKEQGTFSKIIPCIRWDRLL